MDLNSTGFCWDGEQVGSRKGHHLVKAGRSSLIHRAHERVNAASSWGPPGGLAMRAQSTEPQKSKPEVLVHQSPI